MVYGKDQIEKRHRVAVLRAAKAITDLCSIQREHGNQSAIFFNHRNLTAYATARIKASSWEWQPLSDTEARGRMLREENAKMIKEGGYWWLHVREWIAEKDNNTVLKEKLKPLQEAREREFAAWTARLQKMMS
jgi:hypothetical protein